MIVTYLESLYGPMATNASRSSGPKKAPIRVRRGRTDSFNTNFIFCQGNKNNLVSIFWRLFSRQKEAPKNRNKIVFNHYLDKKAAVVIMVLRRVVCEFVEYQLWWYDLAWRLEEWRNWFSQKSEFSISQKRNLTRSRNP